MTLDSLNLLLVEDSADDSELVLRELQLAGYAAHSLRVDSADDLVTALDQKDWDLVIADYSLPGFSGSAAIDIIRGRGLDVPIIVVSGNIGEDIAVETMRAGANDYLMKGHLKRLVPAVKRELREAQMRRERRAAEEALKISEQRYRDLFENANDMIYLRDLEGRFLAINQTGERITGYSREELIGTLMLDLITPETVHHAIRGLSERLEGRQDLALYQVDLICKGGRRIPIEVSTRVVLENDKPIAVQGIVRDVSERRSLEDQLRHAQKLEVVGRLASGVAHDFNNLLMVINGYTELILDAGDRSEPMRSWVEQIAHAGDRAAALTLQLLTFSRSNVAHPRPIDLNATVAGMTAMLQSLIGEELLLRTELRASPSTIEADPNQIEQVLLNLAVNARDAMSRGGTLTVSTDNADAGPGQPDGLARLIVQDEGVGMAEDTKARIFEPFFTTKSHGTGLGLSTVSGIVSQAGGSIEVISELGKGSIFRVSFPISSKPIEAVQPKETLQTGHEAILVVEDDAAVRRLVRNLLRSLGYSVFDVGTAADGHSVLAQHGADLLITDLILSDIGGVRLASELQAASPGLKVLFTSGHSESALEASGVVLAPDVPFIRKPFSKADLAKNVRRLLDS